MDTPTISPTLAEEIIGGLALGPGEVARMVPARRNGRPTSPSTIWRWMSSGIRVNGQVIKLASVRIGTNRLTSRRALLEFLERQQAAQQGEPDPAPTPSPTQSRRRAEVASAIGTLEQMGV